MRKITKAVTALKNVAGNPALLNLVLEENEYHLAQLQKKYPGIDALPQIEFSDLGGIFDGNIDTFLLDGSSLPTDLALLKTLAQGKKSYFEIGTWRGESVWNVAKIIKDCTTLNLPKEEILALGMPQKYAELHGFLSKQNPEIRHLYGNSKTFDFAGLKRTYDLVFIDGDHHYEMVKNDTEKVFNHLLHDNSVVVWHDYAFSPEKIRFEVLRGILDALPVQLHQNLYHVANTLCAVFIKGNFKTKKFETPKKPEQMFQVSISFKTED